MIKQGQCNQPGDFTLYKGQAPRNANFDCEQIKRIKEARLNGKSITSIANEFKKPYGCIAGIIAGRSYLYCNEETE